RAPRGALRSKRNVSSVPPRIAMIRRKQAANIARDGLQCAKFGQQIAMRSCLRFESGLNYLKIDSKLCLREWRRVRVIYKRDAKGPDSCDDICVVRLRARKRTTSR